VTFLGYVGTILGTAMKEPKNCSKKLACNLLKGKGMNGAPGEIRTPDLMLRRHSLYPAELRARTFRILRIASTAIDPEPGFKNRIGSGKLKPGEEIADLERGRFLAI
jgi:hypothetical protein